MRISLLLDSVKDQSEQQGKHIDISDFGRVRTEEKAFVDVDCLFGGVECNCAGLEKALVVKEKICPTSAEMYSVLNFT